jgi:hypothetical protein
MHRRVAGVLLSAPSNPGPKKKKKKTEKRRWKKQRSSAHNISLLCV